MLSLRHPHGCGHLWGKGAKGQSRHGEQTHLLQETDGGCWGYTAGGDHGEEVPGGAQEHRQGCLAVAADVLVQEPVAEVDLKHLGTRYSVAHVFWGVLQLYWGCQPFRHLPVLLAYYIKPSTHLMSLSNCLHGEEATSIPHPFCKILSL